MKYVFYCPVSTDHGVVEIEHPMEEEHPEMICEECGTQMIQEYHVPKYAGNTPNPGTMVRDYLDYNFKRKKAGMPKFSPHKVKRPPE